MESRTQIPICSEVNKCYDPEQRPSWMDSSIDLSQPEIVNVGKKPKPTEINTNFNFYDNKKLKKPNKFIPMHHPYEWNSAKPLNPIRNNPLSRVSESVNPKVIYNDN